MKGVQAISPFNFGIYIIHYSLKPCNPRVFGGCFFSCRDVIFKYIFNHIFLFQQKKKPR